jgi:hypothetical protein
LPPKKMYLIILKKMYIQKFGEEIGWKNEKKNSSNWWT